MRRSTFIAATGCLAALLACSGGAGVAQPDLTKAEEHCERLAMMHSHPCSVVVGTELTVGPAEVTIRSVTEKTGEFSWVDEDARKHAVQLDVLLKNPTDRTIRSPHMSLIRPDGSKSMQISANERPALAAAGGNYVETFENPTIEAGAALETLWVFPVPAGGGQRLLHIWYDEKTVDAKGRTRTKERVAQYVMVLP